MLRRRHVERGIEAASIVGSDATTCCEARLAQITTRASAMSAMPLVASSRPTLVASALSIGTMALPG